MENEVEISELNVSSDADKIILINDIQRFMGEYADPRDEIEEVIAKNLKKSTIMEALTDKVRVGLAYLIPSGYSKFQPQYHLAYIAVDKDHRGSKIGRLLFEKVLHLTGGDFSLHVSPKNQAAISFYEKMGMNRKYFRMTMK